MTDTVEAFTATVLEKYKKVNETIKKNSSCFAISSEWWNTFNYTLEEAHDNSEIPLSFVGPINNLPLIEVNEAYKKSILKETKNEAFSDELLHHLTDWDQMKFKSELKYKEQFVLVSQQVWSYLKNLFKGGPEIEFITEPFLISNVANAGVVTDENETQIAKDYCVNLDLKKLYYRKTGDKDPTPVPCYVSLTVNTKAFFETVCRKIFFPLYKCDVLLLQGRQDSIVLKDYNSKTLAEMGIQENSVLEFNQNKGSGAIPSYEPERRDEQVNDAANKMDIEEIGYELQEINHIIIPLPNSETFQKPRDIFEIEPEKKWDIDLDKVLLVNKQVDQLLQNKQKLSLDYKSLNLIKSNLKELKSEWHSNFKASSAYKNFKKKAS